MTAFSIILVTYVTLVAVALRMSRAAIHLRSRRNLAWGLVILVLTTLVVYGAYEFSSFYANRWGFWP